MAPASIEKEEPPMKYFLHDSSAFQDEKITQLFMEYGYEGLGLFYTILEKLALQEKPIKTDVLKKQLFVRKRLEKCWSFLEEIGLISEKNGETFNEKLLNYAGKFQKNREKNRERVSQFRENQPDTENVTHYKEECNADVMPLKVSKGKVYKDNNPLNPPEGETCPQSRFVKPTIQELTDYFTGRGLNGRAEKEARKFLDYFESVGWKVGKSRKPMTRWEGAASGWVSRMEDDQSPAEQPYRAPLPGYREPQPPVPRAAKDQRIPVITPKR